MNDKESKKLVKSAWDMTDEEFDQYATANAEDDVVAHEIEGEENPEEDTPEVDNPVDEQEEGKPEDVETPDEEAEKSGEEEAEEETPVAEEQPEAIAEEKTAEADSGESAGNPKPAGKKDGSGIRFEKPVILKRKGVEYPVEDLDHLTALAEKGFDYSIKMKQIKDTKEKLKLYEETFGFTPESLAHIKENPKELARWLVKEFGIDPFELEASEEHPAPEYQKVDASVPEEFIRRRERLGTILGNVEKMPETSRLAAQRTSEKIGELIDKNKKGEYNKLDDVMKALLDDMPIDLAAGFLVTPDTFNELLDDIESGVYEKVYGTMLSRYERADKAYALADTAVFANAYDEVKRELYGGAEAKGNAQVPQSTEQRQSPPLQNEQRLAVNPPSKVDAVKQRLISDFNDRRTGAKPADTEQAKTVDYWEDEDAFLEEIKDL